MSSLTAGVADVLERLGRQVPEGGLGQIDAARQRLDEPLRVAIAGRVKAGKSTLLNALIGEPLAATDAAECTRHVTWYTRSDNYQAQAVLSDGRSTQLVLDRSGDAASISLDGIETESEIRRLEVGAPAPSLAKLVLIDTPGIDSASHGLSQRTTGALTPGQGDQGADVLVFLMRHLHTADSQFLEAFNDPSTAWIDPVRTVAVVGRADEIGSGRGDGLVLAEAIAEQYRRDAQLRRLVSEVFPISGLLAFFAATVNQREFETIRKVSALPDHELDLLLGSAARFQGRSDHLSVTVGDRSRLLRRLGLAGVRLAIVAVRSGAVSSTTELAALLAELSGIAPLKRMLLERFAGRAGTLKAARALDYAHHVASQLPGPEGVAIQREVEQLRLNAHELKELDALRQLFEGPADHVAGQPIDRLLRQLGHGGPGLASRLGATEGEDQDELVELASSQVDELRAAASAGYASRIEGDVLMTAATSLEVAMHSVVDG